MSMEFGEIQRLDTDELHSAEAARLRGPDGDLALAADALQTILYPSRHTRSSSHTTEVLVSQFDYSYLRTYNDHNYPFEWVEARIQHTAYFNPVHIVQEYEIILDSRIDGTDPDVFRRRFCYLGELVVSRLPYIGAANSVSATSAEETQHLHYVRQEDCDQLLGCLSELQLVMAHEA